MLESNVHGCTLNKVKSKKLQKDGLCGELSLSVEVTLKSVGDLSVDPRCIEDV